MHPFVARNSHRFPLERPRHCVNCRTPRARRALSFARRSTIHRCSSRIGSLRGHAQHRSNSMPGSARLGAINHLHRGAAVTRRVQLLGKPRSRQEGFRDVGHRSENPSCARGSTCRSDELVGASGATPHEAVGHRVDDACRGRELKPRQRQPR